MSVHGRRLQWSQCDLRPTRLYITGFFHFFSSGQFFHSSEDVELYSMKLALCVLCVLYSCRSLIPIYLLTRRRQFIQTQKWSRSLCWRSADNRVDGSPDFSSVTFMHDLFAKKLKLRVVIFNLRVDC